MIVASFLGAGALAFVPGHLPPLSRSSPISLREPRFGDGLRLSPAVMQFDEFTKRAVAPPAQKAESPEDDDAGVEGGVRALGFLVGGLTGNFVLSVVEGLTSAPTPTTGTVAQVARAPLKTDGLYNAVLPLFESGVIPKLELPGFAGGDTIRAVNSRANEKYGFMFPATEAPPPTAQPPAVQPPPLQPAVEAVVQPVAEAAAGPSGPTGGSLPDDGMTQLQQLQQQLQQLQQLQQQQQLLQQQQEAGSAAVSQLQDTGSSALNQLAAALSPLPQPALAADGLPDHATASLASSLATPLASSLDGASFALASGGGGVGLLAHLLVPLLCGVLGAVGFDALAKQEGPVAAAVKGGGKLVGQAGQALWASVQAGQQVPAGNAGSGEVPARRRMPWEEDGDLQRQWEDEQKGPR